MKDRQNKSNSLVKQGAILAIAAVLVKFIGFVYKIPLQRFILNDQAYSYYYQGFAVYGVILIVSAYGVPAALSKMLSEKNALGKYAEADQILRLTTVITTILSVIGAAVLWFGSDIIASLLGVEQTAYSLRALAPTMLLMPFLCILRGYFQGHNSMVPTAISQILEQLGNVVGGLILASIYVKASLEQGAAGATFGTFVGATLAVLFLLYLFVQYRRKEKHYKAGMAPSTKSDKEVIIMILRVLIPITVVAAITSIINLIDQGMYPTAMGAQGVDRAVFEDTLGLYSGKFLLLTNFPIGIATALAAATIPSIAKSVALKDYKMAESKMNKIIKVVTIVSLPAAVGLGVLARPILLTIFGDDLVGESLEIAVQLFVYGSCTVYFFSIFQITNAVLQGMHHVKEPVKNMLIAGTVKVILNFILLFNLEMGVNSLVFSSIIFSIILTVLNIRSIYKYSNVRFNYVQLLSKPIIASVAMGIIAPLSYKLFFSLLNIISISCLAAIGVGAGTYFVVLILVKGVSRDEMALLPYGNKLADILRIK